MRMGWVYGAMGSASCSVLKLLSTPCRSASPAGNRNNRCFGCFRKSSTKFKSTSIVISSSFLGNSEAALRFSRFIASRSLPAPQNYTCDSSHQHALLLEVEGVLVDIDRLGNRQAFNTAFLKLGLDCANWTEPIYLDLLRKSSGDEEKMLILFFNRIGWPASLPTKEKETFTRRILQKKKNALDELLMTKRLPFRPGVEDFIDDACSEGIPVVILTAYSKSGEESTRSIIGNLGNDRISKIKIVGSEEVEHSLIGRLILGKAMSSGLDEELVKEARKAVSSQKQRIAVEVASMLKLSVDIDTSSADRLQKIVAALHAGAELVGASVSNCVLIAGTQPGVVGAKRIGMPCVILRSSCTSRAEFPAANATMDGFGGADLTISRLRQKIWT